MQIVHQTLSVAVTAGPSRDIDADLLFDRNLELKYERAMSRLGIDPSHLVSDAGHA